MTTVLAKFCARRVKAVVFCPKNWFTSVVAVVFDEELVDRLPAGGHDVRMHAVVTPSGGWQELPRAAVPGRREGDVPQRSGRKDDLS